MIIFNYHNRKPIRTPTLMILASTVWLVLDRWEQVFNKRGEFLVAYTRWGVCEGGDVFIIVIRYVFKLRITGKHFTFLFTSS